MKRTISVILGFVVTLAVGIVLWPTLGSQAQAQPGCKSFEALAQAALPSSRPLGLTVDVWGGPVYIMLGGEFVPGLTAFSGNDGTDIWHRHVGQGRGGSYTVGVNCTAPADPLSPYTCTDTLTIEVPRSVFPIPPGQAGIVSYMGNTAKIVGGTGRFSGASGNLNIRGPAIAWPDPVSPLGASGRWNPEISGNVCGIN